MFRTSRLSKINLASKPVPNQLPTSLLLGSPVVVSGECDVVVGDLARSSGGCGGHTTAAFAFSALSFHSWLTRVFFQDVDTVGAKHSTASPFSLV